MDKICVVQGWDLVASSSADSQIAGVLAGFVFTGIVLLLGGSGLKHRQALGLFFPAFIALAFDSHMFGVVSGGESDPYCVRVWSEEMDAAGVLAVGAMAIVTGLSWLLASHFEAAITPGPMRSHTRIKAINLDRLVTLLAYGVAVTVTLLLASTSYNYVEVAYPQKEPHALLWGILVVALFVFVVSGSAIAWMSTLKADDKIFRTTISSSALQFAAYGLGAYAVAAPIANGLLGLFGVGWLKPPSPLVVGSSMSVGLFAPALLLIALVLAVSPLSMESGKRGTAAYNSASRRGRHALNLMK